MATLPGYNYVGPGNKMGSPEDAKDNLDLTALFHDADYAVMQYYGENPYINSGEADSNFLKSLETVDSSAYGVIAASLGIGGKTYVNVPSSLKYPYSSKRKAISDMYGEQYFKSLDSHGYEQYSLGQGLPRNPHSFHQNSIMPPKRLDVPRMLPVPQQYLSLGDTDPIIRNARTKVEPPAVVSTQKYPVSVTQMDNFIGYLPLVRPELNRLQSRTSHPTNISASKKPHIPTKECCHYSSSNPKHVSLKFSSSYALSNGRKLTFARDTQLPSLNRTKVFISSISKKAKRHKKNGH